MRYSKLLLFVLVMIVLIAMSCANESGREQYTTHVDMFMGMKGNSNCVIGPQLPHGSINPSPQTPNGSHDGYDENEPIRGFGQLHASGTGWGKYGQVLVSPQIGLQTDEEGHDSPKSSEIAQPYYYSVTLDRYGIKAEVTPTHNSAIYRFTFPKSDSSYVWFDLDHNIPMDIATMVKGKYYGGEAAWDPDTQLLTGWGSYAGGYGDGITPYKVYFCAQFNEKPEEVGAELNGNRDLLVSKKAPVDSELGVYARFKTSGNEAIQMRIAVSMHSVGHAINFLKEEVAEYRFKEIKNKALQAWEDKLGKLKVKMADSLDMKKFYTGLYHSYLMPCDRTGDMPQDESGVDYWDDHYDVWDTWRTKFPLMVLIDEPVVSSNIKSFIYRFEKYGVVQPGFIAGKDMEWQQGGDDVDNIIADACVKGVSHVDYEQAYMILDNHARLKRSENYRKYGFEADTGQRMSCSNSLGFAYNDYCAAMVAKHLGKTEDYNKYLLRSQKWEMLWDSTFVDNKFQGFIRPRKPDGEWKEFDPRKNYASWNEYFYESNSWTYSYLVPHQMGELVKISGGEKQFTKKLQYALENDLIGIDNEPSFLAVRAFNYANRPDLTSYWVRNIMNDHYSLAGGYPDNEDSGAMGSWYVFSALGLFPNAGQDIYLLNSPLVEQGKISLSNGKVLEIIAHNQSGKNLCIQRVLFNGEEWPKAWIRHSDLLQGGKLEFFLDKQAVDWAKVPVPSMESVKIGR